MKDVRIYIEGQGYLELTDEFGLSLNYSVAEIQDISQKNSNFSKSITVKGSSQNNLILGNLFNINIVEQSFDLNRKYRAKLYADGTINFEGFIRLLDCKKVSSGKPNDEFDVVYNLQLIDDKYNFNTFIGDKLLEDLSFSAGNHYYTFSAITLSSGYTADNSMYTYFMPYKDALNNYKTTDFKPAIFVKEYWNQIHENAGVSYEISDDVDDVFKRLIIPFNGDSTDEFITIDEVNRRRFRSGITGATTNYIYSGGGNIIIKFNDDTNSPFFDNSGGYNVSTYKWTADRNGYSDFSFSGIADFYLYSASGATGTYLYRRDAILLKNSTSISLPVFLGQNASAGNISINPGLNLLQSAGTISANWQTIQHNPGDVFELVFINNLSHGFQSGSTSVSVQGYAKLTGTNQNTFYNSPQRTALADGDYIELDNYVPKNIKQKDFIASIIKFFNFYVTTDPDNDRKLIYRTRDEFYDTVEYEDWTDKIDLNQDHTIQFLPELQSKELLFTYKEDKDFYNDNYKSSTGKIYSQQRVIFDNEYAKSLSEKKVELIFSPTPLVYNLLSTPLVVPAINSKAPKSNIRILYKPEWLPGSWTYETASGSTFQATFSGYPYAGHYDAPTNPTLSIEWGINDFLYYYEFGNLTDNTLYNKYYSRQISQILDGKLFTGMFDLGSLDILKLDFRKRIRIKDSYFLLNKVSDYNPFSDRRTKVELLKVDDGRYFNRSTGLTHVILTPGEINDIKNVPLTRGDGNVNVGWGVDVVGVDNYVDRYSNTSQVYGSGNTVSGTRNTSVYGDSNRISNTQNSLIVGSGNTINGNGIIAFGNNISATTSNTTYITNATILSSLTISSGATLIFSATTLGIWSSSTGSNSIIANNSTGNYVGTSFGNILGGSGNFIN